VQILILANINPRFVGHRSSDEHQGGKHHAPGPHDLLFSSAYVYSHANKKLSLCALANRPVDQFHRLSEGLDGSLDSGRTFFRIFSTKRSASRVASSFPFEKELFVLLSMSEI